LLSGTEDENSAVAVVDYLTTWILTKKPRKCRSPKQICRSKFSDLKEIDDEHDCDSRISVSSVSESLKQLRNMERAATVESTVSMPGKQHVLVFVIVNLLILKHSCMQCCCLWLCPTHWL
jgi:hypothetical protein